MKQHIYDWNWFYCFLKYSPWRTMHFRMHLNQFSKHVSHSVWGNCNTWVLNASNTSSGVENLCPRNLFLMYEKEKSHWVPNQDCISDDPSIWYFGSSENFWFEPMRENSHCHDEELCSTSSDFFKFLRRFLANKQSCTIQNWPSCIALMQLSPRDR